MKVSRGSAALLLVLFLALLALGAFASLGVSAFAPDRDAASDRALAQAREALIAHAADRPIDLLVGPGYLPCPDLDGDGWAEPTCGSLAGDVGQSQRLGLLPWKTLGLPELRDGHGERLWYAVATKHKGLLNCAASRACVDMSPASALGTLSLRDRGGALLHDGTLTDPRVPGAGAAAVVLAPGAPLLRYAGPVVEQRRDCMPAPCAPAHYLDASPAGEDNADFVDRNDGTRVQNRNGFVAGPVADADGRIVVNDRVAAVATTDLLPRVMTRVALEAAYCLRRAAARDGVLPPPAPCEGASGPLGRVPDFDALEGCSLAAEGMPGWWNTWRDYVLYAPAPQCASAGECIELADPDGRVISRAHRMAIVVATRERECTSPRLRCDAARCTQAIAGAGPGVVLAIP